MLAEPAARGVDGLRATGDVAEQSAKSVQSSSSRYSGRDMGRKPLSLHR
jgi:hypothetical protein